MEQPLLPSVLQGDESADLLAAQEQASASKFHEVQIKLTADCAAMNKFNSDKAKNESRHHVVKVLHEKNQLAVGRKVVDEFMTSNCFMSLSGDMVLVPEVDKIVKATAVKRQASPTHVMTMMMLMMVIMVDGDGDDDDDDDNNLMRINYHPERCQRTRSI